ncbi:MAG TPA: serpin family protein [bacterium]|nr:serpin family protein [bacterium]
MQKQKVLLLSLVLGFMACEKEFSPLSGHYTGNENFSTKQSDHFAAAVDEQYVAAHSKFALAIFKQLSESSAGNIFISPLSLSIALEMTYNGAQEQTKEEIAGALQIDGFTLDEVNQNALSLQKSLTKCDQDIELELCNSIWINQSLEVKADYVERIQRHFLARVDQLDFASSQSKEMINDWVNEKTRGKIPELVESLDCSAMLLINAVVFKGAWSAEFDPQKTETSAFFLPDGRQTAAEFMTNGSANYSFLLGESFKAVRLPFGRDKIAMYLFMPDAAISLATFMQCCDPTDLENWFSEFSPMDKNSKEFKLQIPKFRIAFDITFNESLKKLGMENAFTGSANFLDISEQPIWIDSVRQKAFIEIDEQGCEAAAATLVDMTWSAPASLKFDRPFLFFIRDDRSGTLLFMGKVIDPSI